MIARVWRATATEDGARGYAEHFGGTVLPLLRELDGFQGAYLLRRSVDGAAELQVIAHWESLEKIRDFAGDDLGHAVVEPAAQAVLETYETTVTHYEVVESA